jgi:hypothetical protein
LGLGLGLGLGAEVEARLELPLLLLLHLEDHNLLLLEVVPLELGVVNVAPDRRELERAQLRLK